MLKYIPGIMNFVTPDYRVVKEAVARVRIHPVGHKIAAIRSDWMAVEIISQSGLKWHRGTEKAYIDSNLKAVMDVNPQDEVLAKWPNAEPL